MNRSLARDLLGLGLTLCSAASAAAWAGSGPPAGEWTIIVHGFQASDDAYDDLTAPDGWMRRLAERISDLEGNVNIYKMDANDFGLTVLKGTDPWDVSKHHVLLFDWVVTSNEFADGYAYAAADALYAFLQHWDVTDHVHALFGHSRGAVVISEATRRMILDGNDPKQVVYIDGEGCGPTKDGCVIFADDRFDAWLPNKGSVIHFDNTYSTYDEAGCKPFVPNLGGHHKERCFNLNLGSDYAHYDLLNPFCPPAIYEYLIDNLFFQAGFYQIPGNWTPPDDPNPVDPAMDPVEIPFNGNFEWGSPAGWTGHGGLANGIVTEHEGTAVVLLTDAFPVMTHNLFWVPNGFGSLSYQLWVPQSSTEGTLEVTISTFGNQSALLASIPLDSVPTEKFVTLQNTVPNQFRGAVCLLTYEYLPGDPGTGIFIDAIEITELPRDNIHHVPSEFETIQLAINFAQDGDEVVVAPGTYPESINFLGKAITVRSSGGPDVTTIDAQGSGSVVTCADGEGRDTVLDGFTITGGTGTPQPFNPTLAGGGMYNFDSSPTVTNCTFSENSALAGGGMYNKGGTSTVTNCTFSGSAASDNGGAMYNSGGNPTITNCTFTANTADGSGGAMYNFEGSPTITSCAFINNTAEGRTPGPFEGGGGMHNRQSSPTVTGCTFTGNSAHAGGGMHQLFCSSSPTVTNTTFTANNATWGGGMYHQDGTSTLTNCTFSGNQADAFGGGLMNEGSDTSTILINCTFSGNSAQDGGGMRNQNTMSVVIGESSFCDNSPNHLSGDWTDDGGNCLADSCADNNGNGVPDECECTGDIDGDGNVGVKDLLILLGAWGPNPGHPADFDGSGDVGVKDLLVLLGNWGPCT